MTYVNDAIQVVFLLLLATTLLAAVKVFFLDPRKKRQ